MKTNVVMSRPMGRFNVLQRTVDGYFNATDLYNQWNRENPKEQRYIDNFWRQTYVIRQLEYYKTIGINWGDTSRGRYTGGTWLEPSLFLSACLYLDYAVYSNAKKFMADNNVINDELFPDTKRLEKVHLHNIELAINATHPEYKVTYQRRCCDGRFLVDMLIENDRVESYTNAPDETFVDYTVIEYDEDFHERQKDADLLREIQVCSDLVMKAREQGLNATIEVLRIKQGLEGLMYAYGIPYITRENTNTAQDKLVESGMLKNVYSRECDCDVYNIGFTY